MRLSFRQTLAYAAFSLIAAGSPIIRAQEPAPPTKGPAVGTNLPTAVDPTPLGNLLAPKAFRAASARVMPSLVMIESFGGVSGGKRGQMQGIRMPGEGPTTGVIISSDGYIVTSTFNFLKKPPIITVVLPDGQRKVAKLLGQDETRKLCVLKVEGVQGLSVPEFAPRTQLRVGQWAVALGVGFGDDDPALSAGIVSATSRINGKAVQTDANLSPANYGGPLVDLEGRIIGICVPLSPQSKEVASGVEWYDSGIGFAVPLDNAEQLLTRLKAGETLKPGYMGIKPTPTPDQKPGAIVGEVLKDAPADKGGVKKDDRIVTVGGEEVLDPTHLISLVGRYNAGDDVKVTVKRGEETIELTVKLEVPPPPAPMPMPGQPPMDPKPEDKKPEDKKPAEPKPAEPKSEDQKPEDKQPEEPKPDSPANQ